jgi:hypothetical protein
MEATCSYGTWVDFQRTTQRYIPEDRTLHNDRCENLKSYTGHALIRGVERSNAQTHLLGKSLLFPVVI